MKNFFTGLKINGDIVLIIKVGVRDFPVVVVTYFFDNCQSQAKGIGSFAFFFETFEEGTGS